MLPRLFYLKEKDLLFSGLWVVVNPLELELQRAVSCGDLCEGVSDLNHWASLTPARLFYINNNYISREKQTGLRSRFREHPLLFSFFIYFWMSSSHPASHTSCWTLQGWGTSPADEPAGSLRITEWISQPWCQYTSCLWLHPNGLCSRSGFSKSHSTLPLAPLHRRFKIT